MQNEPNQKTFIDDLNALIDDGKPANKAFAIALQKAKKIRKDKGKQKAKQKGKQYRG